MFKSFTCDKFLNAELDWKAQISNSLKNRTDFEKIFTLTEDERKGFEEGVGIFNIQVTPYYASLVDQSNLDDPIRKMIMPSIKELEGESLSQNDPLGENKHRPCSRLIHRYSDRVLFLVTDYCGIYCRYCTRKHFTGGGAVFPKKTDYEEALDYIRQHPEIKEVILSGGDPLTLSNTKLEKILSDLEAIKHIELIRVGSRLPAAAPMRLDEGLLNVFKRKIPVVLMVHFNHHQELSVLAKKYLRNFAEHGVQIFNQMVLLSGVNNSSSLVYKLSRELLSCKVFPYYMFQCDPSPGTAHLRTSIDESLEIQKELWGKASGLSLPTYSVDIPSGGGKAYLTPNFIEKKSSEKISFKGFDGVSAEYYNPIKRVKPYVSDVVRKEWERVSSAKEVF